jgi:hypothetical protein
MGREEPTDVCKIKAFDSFPTTDHPLPALRPLTPIKILDEAVFVACFTECAGLPSENGRGDASVGDARLLAEASTAIVEVGEELEQRMNTLTCDP